MEIKLKIIIIHIMYSTNILKLCPVPYFNVFIMSGLSLNLTLPVIISDYSSRSLIHSATGVGK